ncbi:MAG: lysylphosphatidylglycerol synthetase family protein [Chlorobi bacterium]|nr:lysylphosphatidylglycerol synthetase family protein [Chlorobiota bacterium]
MKNNLRILIRNKSFWQISLALFMIVFFLYFIKNEHIEINDIHNKLTHAKSKYIILGILSTLVYVILQGLMYVFSFRAIHQKVSLTDSITLFLKRNFISVFLPAGGVSSLAFFTKPLVKKEITKTQIYYASFIYAITGILTVIIIAIPAIILSLKTNQSTGTSVFHYILILSGIILAVVLLVYFIIFKEFGSEVIAKIWPDFLISLDNLRSNSISSFHFVLVIGISLLIEIIGIFQLYLALMAVGIPANITISLIGYVLMTVFLILSPFLRGLGAIEVSLTLLLTHYGFATIQAASGMLLFRFFEFWLPLGLGLLIFLVKPGKILLRIFPTALLFLLGLTNILSAITPAIPERMQILTNYLPVRIIEASNLFVLAFGIILLANSYFLLRRLKPAWWLAFLISVLSLIGHLTKGIDYEEAFLAGIVVITLLFTYKEYVFKSIINVSRHFFYMTVLIGITIIIFNIAGFYYIEKYHFNHDFSLYDSCVALIHTWSFNDSSQIYSQTSFAKLFLIWIRISGIGLMGILAYGIFKPKFQYTQNQPEQINKAIELVGLYGNSPLDYFKTYFDKILFFPESPDDGFLAYKFYKGVSIVLENPVCSPEKRGDILREFEHFCSTMDYIYFIYRIPDKDIQLYKDLGMKTLPIGQEAIVNLDRFSLEGREMKSIRNAIRKAEKSGYTAKIYLPPVPDGKLQQLQQVSDEWLSANKRDELVFSQGLFKQSEVKNTTILASENSEGKIAGFLNIIPDYKKNEGTYDLIRKTNDAPNGIIDYQIIKMFEYFKSLNLHYANMGMVPITGKELDNLSITQALNLLSKVIHKFNDFNGLREFKEKFKPEWETRYLAYQNDFDLILLPRALSEIMKPE